MAATTDPMTVPTGDGWEELRAQAALDVAHAEAKLENVTRVGNALVYQANLTLRDVADAAKADRHAATDDLREACSALVRCNRACGLNADGTERKARARKGAPEVQQATLPETTGGEQE